MKKTLLLLTIIFLIACEGATNVVNQPVPEEEQVLSKEAQVRKLYADTVVPLFRDLGDLTIPSAFKIDEKDLEVNAGAAFGYVEVSRGLVNLEEEAVQLFVLSHEISHIASLTQARIFGLQGEVPAGPVTNPYIKAEYLADLMAVHLIKSKLPEQYHVLSANFSYLEKLLGNSSFTHPSGEDRISSIQSYLQEGEAGNEEAAFRNKFVEIWRME